MTEQFYMYLSFTLIFSIIINIIHKTFKHKASNNKANSKSSNKKHNHNFENKSDLIVQIIVRSELKMGKGKIAAQVGHAIAGTIEYLIGNQKLWEAWKNQGQPKIVLRATNIEIEETLEKLRKTDVYVYKVYDAGRTQVKSGSNTVIAIGPAPKSILKLVTGSLKLL